MEILWIWVGLVGLTIGGLVLRIFLASVVTSVVRVLRSDTSDLKPREFPSLTAVVPAYNEGDNIEQIVESLLSATYPPEKLRIIISYETTSDDDTPQRAKRVAQEHQLVTAIAHTERAGGKARNVNFALDHVESDVIAIFDADQKLHPNALARAAWWFSEEEAICVRGRYYPDLPVGFFQIVWAVERHIAEVSDLFFRELLSGFTIYGGGQVFIQRQFLETIGRFDEWILLDDVEMTTRVHLNGERIRIDPELITYGGLPTTVAAWQSQRERWIRGWLQIMRKHLITVIWSNKIDSWRKADAAVTLSYAIVPIAITVFIPGVVVWATQNAAAVIGFVVLTGLLWTAAAVVYLVDTFEDKKHRFAEIVAVPLLWGVFVFQLWLFIKCAINEFVIGSSTEWLT